MRKREGTSYAFRKGGRSTILELENVYGAYKHAKFWAIVIAISAISGVMLPILIRDVARSPTPGESLWLVLLIMIGTFGLCLLPFAIWQHVSRKRFFRWLSAQWANLETGAKHPDGYIITYDTPLVQYQVVFSAVLATVSFASRPYVLQSRAARVAQVSSTFFSVLFGWEFLGVEGVAETIKAVLGNVRSSQAFSLRQLLSQQGRIGGRLGK